MFVKGVAVKTVPDFVKKMFGGRYNEWLAALSDESRLIMTENIIAVKWYQIKPAFIEPTEKICDLFYAGRELGAWECGRYSADIALSGIYKFFIKVASPNYTVSKGTTIFTSYYNPSDMKIIESLPKKMILHITRFPEPSKFVEYRVAGWIHRAIEMAGAKSVNVNITKSLANGDSVTEIVAVWK